jgi:hypothetical protein
MNCTIQYFKKQETIWSTRKRQSVIDGKHGHASYAARQEKMWRSFMLTAEKSFSTAKHHLIDTAEDHDSNLNTSFTV